MPSNVESMIVVAAGGIGAGILRAKPCGAEDVERVAGGLNLKGWSSRLWRNVEFLARNEAIVDALCAENSA